LRQSPNTLALHSAGLDCHNLASLDPELQRVIAACDRLPAAIHKGAVIGPAMSRLEPLT
jgi:hypothetical protein